MNGKDLPVVAATVLSGATLQLNSGGVASGVTVESAGTLILGGGASMSGISLAFGAALEYANTTFTSVTVASGSTLVASGGEAFDTIVDGGGLANFHGTTVIGGTISGGGTLALLDNAAAGGTFTFAGRGILQVEVPQPFPALNILSAAVGDGFGATPYSSATKPLRSTASMPPRLYRRQASAAVRNCSRGTSHASKETLIFSHQTASRGNLGFPDSATPPRYSA